MGLVDTVVFVSRLWSINILALEVDTSRSSRSGGSSLAVHQKPDAGVGLYVPVRGVFMRSSLVSAGISIIGSTTGSEVIGAPESRTGRGKHHKELFKPFIDRGV